MGYSFTDLGAEGFFRSLNSLLFLPYKNDMPNCHPKSRKTRLFANDSNIFIIRQSPYILENELKTTMDQILRWLEDNELTVNLNKTQYSTFQTKNMSIPDWLCNIKFNSNFVRWVHSARFVGIELDEKLKWDDHVKQLSEWLTQTMNAFKMIKTVYQKIRNKCFTTHTHIYIKYIYIHSRKQYDVEMDSS